MTLPPLSVIQARPARLLLVDDDPDVLSALRRLIHVAEPDWVVCTANHGRFALDVMQGESVDVVVTDLNMPVMDGFELLQRLERSHPETIRVVHSSHTETLAKELLRYLAHNIIPKPAPPDTILAVLRWAVRGSAAGGRQAAEA